MRRDVFQAIADPTRREIISLIAHQSLNVNGVAGNFDVSRTAIYKHVKILTECGLIVVKQQGRERYYEAQLEKLHEVSDWVGQYRQFWNARLDALEGFLNAGVGKEIKVADGGKGMKVAGGRKRKVKGKGNH
jgi:DNA-binding transcriptional ArsR family regulator